MRYIAISILACAMSACSHYVLYEKTAMGPEHIKEVRGTFSQKEACEARRHAFAIEDMREQMRNGPNSMVLGRVTRVCVEE